MLRAFSIEPDYDLNVMQAGQTAGRIRASRILAALEPVLDREKPDWVIVQGDDHYHNFLWRSGFVLQRNRGGTHVEAGCTADGLIRGSLFPKR